MFLVKRKCSSEYDIGVVYDASSSIGPRKYRRFLFYLFRFLVEGFDLAVDHFSLMRFASNSTIVEYFKWQKGNDATTNRRVGTRRWFELREEGGRKESIPERGWMKEPILGRGKREELIPGGVGEERTDSRGNGRGKN